jgi:hypothetical protein
MRDDPKRVRVRQLALGKRRARAEHTDAVDRSEGDGHRPILVAIGREARSSSFG